ncbi:MAG: hypothetical protein MJ252_15640, partial [archaeon]|nr:hypothetical protein [archaeon]
MDKEIKHEDKNIIKPKDVPKRMSENNLSLRKGKIDNFLYQNRKKNKHFGDPTSTLDISLESIIPYLPKLLSEDFDGFDDQLGLIKSILCMDFTSISEEIDYNPQNDIFLIYFALLKFKELVDYSESNDLYKEENTDLLFQIYYGILKLMEEKKEDGIIVFNCLNILIGLSCDYQPICQKMYDNRFTQLLDIFSSSVLIEIHCDIVWIYSNLVFDQTNNALFVLQNTKLMESIIKMSDYLKANGDLAENKLTIYEMENYFNFLKKLIDFDYNHFLNTLRPQFENSIDLFFSLAHRFISNDFFTKNDLPLFFRKIKVILKLLDNTLNSIKVEDQISEIFKVLYGQYNVFNLVTFTKMLIKENEENKDNENKEIISDILCKLFSIMGNIFRFTDIHGDKEIFSTNGFLTISEMALNSVLNGNIPLKVMHSISFSLYNFLDNSDLITAFLRLDSFPNLVKKIFFKFKDDKEISSFFFDIAYSSFMGASGKDHLSEKIIDHFFDIIITLIVSFADKQADEYGRTSLINLLDLLINMINFLREKEKYNSLKSKLEGMENIGFVDKIETIQGHYNDEQLNNL